MNAKFVVRFVVGLLLLLSIFFITSAAAEQNEVEGYLIEFNSPDQIKARLETMLSFRLLNATNKEPLPFGKMWLRIVHDKQIIFSGTLSPENNAVDLHYAFLKSGAYVLTVEFHTPEVKTKFLVQAARGNFPLWMWITGILIFLIFLGAILANRPAQY